MNAVLFFLGIMYQYRLVYIKLFEINFRIKEYSFHECRPYFFTLSIQNLHSLFQV